MADIPNREKVCHCEICESCYHIVEFTEMLADPKKVDKILRAMELSERSEHKREKVILALLVGATAEYAFRNGAHPEMIFEWLGVFWNKRTLLVMKELEGLTSEERAAIRRKLEEYES